MNYKLSSYFATPLLEVCLDLDTNKLTEFAFEMWNNDREGKKFSNKGGWHSDNIRKENHKEFIRLKKEINQYLQTYHLKVFREMEFEENVIQQTDNMWININEKHDYNEWHIHPFSTLSGVYYIKHDGSIKNGNITLKHPTGLYMNFSHWPAGFIKKTNEITSELIHITPKSNMLLVFPSWLEHRVETNLKDYARISVSFNSSPILEKKS